MNRKHLDLTIKRAPPNGTAVFDPTKLYTATAWAGKTEDRYGDMFDASTFDLMVLDKHPLPLLFGHDSRQIAGAIDKATVIDGDLQIEFRLADTDLGRELATLIDHEALNNVSVGYIEHSAERRELLEVSLVAVPANADAVITTRSITPPASGELPPEKEQQTMNAPAIHTRKQEPYSLSKFILGLSDPTARQDAGFEFEMSQEAARISGKSSSTPMVPFGAIAKAQDTITAPSGGSDLGMSLATPQSMDDLFTVAQSASFLQSAAGMLGVGIYNAPKGEFKVPRMVTPIVPAWVARDADVPTVDGRFDALDMKPHTLGAVTQINRSALIDTAPPMQNVISDAIWAAVLNALDNAMLGAVTPDADQPDGLYTLVQGTATDFDDFVDPLGLLTSLAAIADLTQGEAQAMIASHRFQAWARTTAMSATLTATPVLADPNSALMAGMKQCWSGRMTAFNAGGTAPTPPAVNNWAFFGPFASHVLTVLFGGGVELAVNPYASTVYSKGAILVRCMTDADILVRDAGKFGIGFIEA